MKQERLNEIIEQHRLWLSDNENGERADLSGVILSDADLSFAFLNGANLCGANLSDADLSRASFNNCFGNNREIKSAQFTRYNIVYTKDVMLIGCQTHPIKEWFAFTDEEIDSMDEHALEWWKEWKPILKTIMKVED